MNVQPIFSNKQIPPKKFTEKRFAKKFFAVERRAHVFSTQAVAQPLTENKNRAKFIYDSLLDQGDFADSRIQRHRSYSYLLTQLEAAEHIDAHLPANPNNLAAWMADNVKTVGDQYQSYIVDRKGGLPRRFFATKSQALHFLRGVAPTKLVDGAWLYGVLKQWRSPHMAPLIDTYLDELGRGVADCNHVVLYKKLLAGEGIDSSVELSEGHYVQGAIQLALAHHGDSFLPEILGFNLGYEQLPLHLLITAYELRELGIDPHYFTLHVTIDNLHSGHAQKALQGIMELLPRVDDGGAFYRRVIRGYKLNFLGESTWSIIGGFNLENELVDMLGRKSELGRLMHSNHQKIGDRMVNDWLSSPSAIRKFLAALIDSAWVHPNQDPDKSRFWHLIADKKAPMAGVFTSAEQQLIYDWIAGDTKKLARNKIRTPNEFGDDDKLWGNIAPDINNDGQSLQKDIAQLRGKEATLDHLVRYLSPSLHHTLVGLAATRFFANLLR